MRKIVEKIKNSENILVALSRDPSVDEMAAAIGLTMFLDSLQKHTTAIYSGQTPDALQFLQPEGTFETNTDSLRDFIIALSKDKADHLRYKLDGDFVKVFITPYKTTLSESDLEFTYGDFNVNLVLALGVPTAGDLDEALAEYGRIMHDATTVDITVDAPGKFGEIEWSDPGASSVSEMVTKLIFAIQGPDAVVDKEIATALLTGIVAATGRFSNDRTNSETMQIASKLMSMGADQQLISANVMDNNFTPSEYNYSAPQMAPVDRTNLLVGQDYNRGAAMEPTVVAETETVVQPVVPEPVAPNPVQMEQAAAAAAATEAVSTAVAEAVANAGAAGATGIGIDPAKDYGQMMDQALAEATPGVTQPLVTPAVEPAVANPAIGPVPASAVPVASTTPLPEGAAEPVAKEEDVVLPPPPAPVAGDEVMPPVLPPVQVPADVAAKVAAESKNDAFQVPGA